MQNPNNPMGTPNPAGAGGMPRMDQHNIDMGPAGAQPPSGQDKACDSIPDSRSSSSSQYETAEWEVERKKQAAVKEKDKESGAPRPDISATPFGLGSLGGLSGVGNIGIGSANFMEMQQRIQRELLQKPEMLRSMMEIPFVQQMMSNPRQLMTAQMRELMDRNPEITDFLNNPELMPHLLARNPTMLQELLSNLEYETDEEREVERKKQAAVMEKDKV